MYISIVKVSRLERSEARNLAAQNVQQTQIRFFHLLQSAAAVPTAHSKTIEQIANVGRQHTDPRQMGSPVEAPRALSDMTAYRKLKIGVPIKGA